MRGLATTALAALIGLTLAATAAFADEVDETGTNPIKTFEDILEEQKAKKLDKGRLGLHLGLLGPASLLDLQVSYGAHEMVDVVLSVGFNWGSEDDVGDPYALHGPTEDSAFTVALRGRLIPWAWRKGDATHGPIFELGVGMSSFSFSSEGKGAVEGEYTYSPGDNFGGLLAGVGYTYRMKMGLRFNATLGWTQYFGELTLPPVATSGTVHADDVENLQKTLDEKAKEIDDSRLYGELAVGWVF